MTDDTQNGLRYVVITAAKNEAAYIGRALAAMAAQTVPPLRWFIVSDGSTDDTDALVRRHAEMHPWTTLIRLPERAERHWGAKVDAFNAGYAQARELEFDCVANLDADVSLSPNYFACLLEHFARRPRLGVAGGEVFDAVDGREVLPVCHDRNEVPGPCQFFRRACFDAIGGYCRTREGIEDTIATMSAMMHGWDVARVTDCRLVHHRPVGGMGGRSVFKVGFLYGTKDYLLGDHPLWEAGRFVYRMQDKPYVLSSGVRLAAYAWAALRRRPRPVSAAFVAFRRRWQMQRLRAAVGLGRGARA
jgi:poly-beta-1,6-N-acetyl-D-glucosamine synthase